MKGKIERGELTKYTKKEQLDFAKENAKMSRTFDGLALLNRLPDGHLLKTRQFAENIVIPEQFLSEAYGKHANTVTHHH